MVAGAWRVRSMIAAMDVARVQVQKDYRSELERLAMLPSAEYQDCRGRMSRFMGIETSILDWVVSAVREDMQEVAPC